MRASTHMQNIRHGSTSAPLEAPVSTREAKYVASLQHVQLHLASLPWCLLIDLNLSTHFQQHLLVLASRLQEWLQHRM
jgi:hypothetical protein